MDSNTTTAAPLLFNDVYSDRWEALSPAPGCTSFPFPRLPVELRLHVWLLYLQRHRLIEVDISGPADDDAPDDPASRYYIDRNHLGRVISGGRYTLAIRGGEFITTPLILQVNREAREAALRFYQIHLPFSRWQDYRKQVLYLNPKYDVISVGHRDPKTPPSCPGWNWRNPRPRPKFANLLVDFLHDARAYDYEDQGVAHLALDKNYQSSLFHHHAGGHLTPANLHPAAAASFTDILRNKLHSLLCLIDFRECTRGHGEWPMAGWRFHFAQTFPLIPRCSPTGTFHWLTTDPRPGIEIDLRQLPLNKDPRHVSRDWCQVERAFGITQTQRADRFRFYICPAQFWHKRWSFELLGVEDEQDVVWSRSDLVRFLKAEAENWLHTREYFGSIVEPGILPKYPFEYRDDAEMLEAMEKLPCTAVGIWLFPAEVFKEPTLPLRNCYDLSTVRPGLFLFEV